MNVAMSRTANTGPVIGPKVVVDFGYGSRLTTRLKTKTSATAFSGSQRFTALRSQSWIGAGVYWLRKPDPEVRFPPRSRGLEHVNR